MGDFRRGLSGDWPILVAVLAIWIMLLAALASVGVSGFRFSAYFSNLVIYLSALIFFIALRIGQLLIRHRPDRPIGFLRDAFAHDRLVPRLHYGAPMMLALILFMPAFSAMKSAIPLFQPYQWDGTWIALDRTLHGTDPWRVLQPVLGYPIVTSALSLLYHLWIMLIYAGGIYFCFYETNRSLRTRYFIAYFLCWLVIGILAATALASVGPCFVGPLLGDTRFEPLMAYLHHADQYYPVMTLPVQDQLIAYYHSGDHGLGRGISAMPSMHVSLAFLFFLSMRHIGRRVAVLFGLFFAIILIGSVHLAYHYAVDGYAAIIATGIIWIVAGRAARLIGHGDRQDRQPAGATTDRIGATVTGG